MTASELQKVLQQAIDAGASDAEMIFDSEAQKFCVHMVQIESTYFYDADMSAEIAPDGKPFVSLHYGWKGQVE